MISLLIVILIISVSLWSFWAKLLKNGSGHILTGSIPIVGHTYKIIGNTEKLWEFIRDVSVESLANGGVARMFLGMQTYYVITDPEDLATAGNTCLNKHFSFSFAKAWLGDGLVTSSGSIWKRHRKLLNPAFGLHLLFGFLPIFNDEARELVVKLANVVGTGPVDIASFFKDNAMQTLSQTTLGMSGLKNPSLFKKYTHAADQILEMIVMRFQNIWLQSNLVYKLTGLMKKETDLVKVLNDMSHDVIKEKRLAMKIDGDFKTSGSKYKSLLDLMLEHAGSNLTDKEIREEVDTFIVAGTDTSSWLMSYICAALGTYPEVQEKLYEELHEIFGDSDRDVNRDDLPNLVYTEAVIKETLRLYPVATVSLRTLDTGVQLKNHYLRPGDHVVMSFYGVNRHPIWGADADQFRPERWLEADNLGHAYGGFGIGKRSCIGKTYSMMYMKTTLAHILRHYSLSGDVTKLKLKMDFIAKPICGHLVTIEQRFNRLERLKNFG